MGPGGWRQTVKMTKVIGGLVALTLCSIGPAVAADSMAEVVVEVGDTVTIPAPGFQKSQVLDGDKVGFEILPDGIKVTGKEIGRTQIFVWDAQQRLKSYQVRVVAPGERARDRERDLMAALDADPLTRGAGLTVRWNGDTVTLTGAVASAAAAARAAAIAGQHAGRVENQLTVQALPRPAVDGPLQPGGPLPVIGPPTTSRPGASPMPALAPLEVKIDDIKKAGRLDLTAGEVRLVSVPTEIKRVMIGTEDVADVVLIPPREVAVIAKGAGETTLMVWYLGTDLFLGQEEKAEIAINVMARPESEGDGDLPGLEEIDRVLGQLGATNIEVITSKGTPPRVLLFGEVTSDLMRSKVEQALQALFPAQTPIANFIEVQRAPRMNEAELAVRAAQLERRIAEELPNAAVRVRLHEDPLTDSYRVLLTGEAAVPAERLRAEQIVEFELGPAQQITNHITTPLPPPPTDLLLAGGEEAPPLPPIAEALGEAIASAGVNTDRVVMEVDEQRRVVALRGSVRTEDDQYELLDAIGAVLDQYGEWELRERGLSVAKPRVVTEVQIIELTASDSQNLGVAYGVPIGGSQDGGGGGGGTSGTTGGTSVDNSNGLVVYGERTPGASIARLDPIAARIQALVTNNRARVLQEPYIASDDGEQGTVELVTEVPLPSTTTGTGGTTGVSVEFRPVGIRLMVTPRVMFADPADRIQMTIETEVSAIDFGIAINIGGSVVPAITNRQALTTVTVDNGETFVIGGLTSETERKNVSRIPFLSDIPIIGELFKTTETNKEQTTVVVVMTPRINW